MFDPTGTIAGGTLAQLMAAVNALFARGGGDCPEFGMTGLQIALNQINGLPPLAASLSQIILITDASAKDDFLLMNVIAQAGTLGVRIHELLIRNGCTGQGFLNYPLIAMSTGGILVNNLVDFGAITNFVQELLLEDLEEMQLCLDQHYPHTPSVYQSSQEHCKSLFVPIKH